MVEKAPPTFVKAHIRLVVLDSTVPGLELPLHPSCYDFSSLYPFSRLSQTVLSKPLLILPFRQPRYPLPTITLRFLITCQRGSPSSLSRTLTYYAYLLIFLSPISCAILRPVVAGLSQAFRVFNLS